MNTSRYGHLLMGSCFIASLAMVTAVSAQQPGYGYPPAGYYDYYQQPPPQSGYNYPAPPSYQPPPPVQGGYYEEPRQTSPHGYPMPGSGYSQPSYQGGYVSPREFFPMVGRRVGEAFRRMFYGDGQLPNDDEEAYEPEPGIQNNLDVPPSYGSHYGYGSQSAPQQPRSTAPVTPRYQAPQPQYPQQQQYSQQQQYPQQPTYQVPPQQPRYEAPPANNNGSNRYTPMTPQNSNRSSIFSSKRSTGTPLNNVPGNNSYIAPPPPVKKSPSTSSTASKPPSSTSSTSKKSVIRELPPSQSESSASSTATKRDSTPTYQSPPSTSTADNPPATPRKSQDVASTPPSTSANKKPASESSGSSGNSSGSSSGSFLKGKRTSKPGRVISPYPPYQELDVTGLSSGSLAMDPTTQKVFEIP